MKSDEPIGPGMADDDEPAAEREDPSGKDRRVSTSITDFIDLGWFASPKGSTFWMRMYEFLPDALDDRGVGKAIRGIDYLGLPIKLTFGLVHDLKVPRIQTSVVRPPKGDPKVVTTPSMESLPEAHYAIITCPLQIDTGAKGPGNFARVKPRLDGFAALLRSHLGMGGLWRLVYEGERYAHNGVWAAQTGHVIRLPQTIEIPRFAAADWRGAAEVIGALETVQPDRQRRMSLALHYLNLALEQSEFIHYWTALEVLCGKAGKIRAVLEKAYDFKNQHVADRELQFDIVRGWRTNLVHHGVPVTLSAETERYLQYLFLDLIRHSLGLEHLGHAEALLKKLDLRLSAAGT